MERIILPEDMDRMNARFASSMASLKISLISRRPILEKDLVELFYLEKDGFPVLDRLKGDKDDLLLEMYKMLAKGEEKIWAQCQAFNARLNFLSLCTDEHGYSSSDVKQMRRNALSVFRESCKHIVIREQLKENPDFFREYDLAFFKAVNTRRKLTSVSGLRF